VKVIGSGNLDYKVAVNTKDEIGQLSEAFNNMSVDLKVSQKELLQYEHIISCSTDMLAFMDKKFIYVAANPAYLEAFKKPREELIGHTASEVFGEEFFDTVIKPNAELCLTGKEVNYQTWFKFPAYGQRYMDITYYPYTNADNAVIGFVVNGRNITEKKLAEEELVRSRQKSLLHVQRTPLAVIEWNTNFEVTEWNPAAEKIFGYRKKEALGHHAEFIIHENAKELVNEVWQNLLAQQGGKRSTNENITKDGNTIFCEWYNTPLVSESGEVLGVASLAQDVTEVKLAEEKVKAINASLEQRVTERTAELVKANKKIQDSEKTLRSIIDNTIAVIYLKDIQGKYILINSQYELLFHVSKEEVVGKTDYDLFPEDKADAFLRNDRKVIEVRQPLEFEEIVPHDDGLHTYISIKFPLFSAEDAVYGVCSISTDITELKKMEDELAKVQKLESVGTLASGIAHDFNNYLQGIMSNITTVKECIETSDELYRNLANAEKAVLQAKDLTQQLLTFSRGGEPVKKAVFASELIKESANFALSGSNVRCELDVPDCRCLVEADKGQMNQVINNLLINANQAMPEGGVVKIKAENTNIKAKDSLPLKEGKYVRITIADQGTGISKEHLQKIFDPFFTTKKEGTGLGLTTAYSIIKRHGGYITVESKVGTGTTFYIYLPASEGKISSETVPIKERDKRGKGKDVEKATPLEDGKRILFMEDNLLISMSVAEHLRNLKYEVQTTQNGTKAIELYKSAIKSGKPFDAVVMDLTIPDDMGGKEAIKELLKIDPNVKAVVASGYSNDPVMANFRKYGFRGVVAKPYEAYDLDELLQKVIAKDN
jgi:PAS domain S-box-containing protein